MITRLLANFHIKNTPGWYLTGMFDIQVSETDISNMYLVTIRLTQSGFLWKEAC